MGLYVFHASNVRKAYIEKWMMAATSTPCVCDGSKACMDTESDRKKNILQFTNGPNVT